MRIGEGKEWLAQRSFISNVYKLCSKYGLTPRFFLFLIHRARICDRQSRRKLKTEFSLYKSFDYDSLQFKEPHKIMRNYINHSTNHCQKPWFRFGVVYAKARKYYIPIPQMKISFHMASGESKWAHEAPWSLTSWVESKQPINKATTKRETKNSPGDAK